MYQKLGVNCFADDTGLEIEALDGDPGVYSARYAGAQKSSDANMDKVLQKLKGKSNRNAHFKPVIALTLALAFFDLGKTIIRHEVFSKSESLDVFVAQLVLHPSFISFPSIPKFSKKDSNHDSNYYLD